MKQTAQQTPPPLKQETSSSLSPQSGLKGWLSRQKPGLIMTVAALFLVPSTIGFVGDLVSNRLHSGPFVIEETAWEWGDTGSGDLSVDQIGPTVLLQDEAITTFKIQKSNPDYRSYVSLEVETINTLTDEERTDWPQVGTMGFGCSEIWVSSVTHFYSGAPKSSDQIEVDADLSEEYSDYIGTYYYPYDEESLSLSTPELLERYKKEFPTEYATIQVDSTGVESQSGIVTYTVTNPDTIHEYDTLNGYVNIVFKKNDQVVFGVVEHYSTSSSVQSKTFAYSPNIQLPEYDEVEIINMHS